MTHVSTGQRSIQSSPLLLVNTLLITQSKGLLFVGSTYLIHNNKNHLISTFLTQQHQRVKLYGEKERSDSYHSGDSLLRSHKNSTSLINNEPSRWFRYGRRRVRKRSIIIIIIIFLKNSICFSQFPILLKVDTFTLLLPFLVGPTTTR